MNKKIGKIEVFKEAVDELLEMVEDDDTLVSLKEKWDKKYPKEKEQKNE